MNWCIPAKTFLLGEYAALGGASALLLNTKPFFELRLNTQNDASIHPESPAGLFWAKQQTQYHLSFIDPYQGRGGLGASSAQFLGAYLASLYLQGKKPHLEGLLEAYYQCAWTGQGLKPSAYDLIAQTQYGCVFINKQAGAIQSYPWNFDELSFILLHTGRKLATHHHLEHAQLTLPIDKLSVIVEKAQKALQHGHSALFIDSVNHYHEALKKLGLVAIHSLELIEELRHYKEILAIKGCGALGADVLLLISLKSKASFLKEKLSRLNRMILATEMDLTNSEDSQGLTYFNFLSLVKF